MNTRTKVAVGSGLVIAMLLAVWFFNWFSSDPEISKLQEIGEQLAAAAPSDRDALREQLRQQMQSLSDDQRQAFFQANREQWQARQQQRMDEFFGLSRREQQKRLDETLGRMNRSGNERRPPGGNTASTAYGRAGRTESQREERAKRRLDGSTPRARAQFAEYRRRLNERAQQLGLQVNGRPRGAS